MMQYMSIRGTDKVFAELNTFSGELGAGQSRVGHKLKAAGRPSTSSNLGELGLHPQSLNFLEKDTIRPNAEPSLEPSQSKQWVLGDIFRCLGTFE